MLTQGFAVVTLVLFGWLVGLMGGGAYFVASGMALVAALLAQRPTVPYRENASVDAGLLGFQDGVSMPPKISRCQLNREETVLPMRPLEPVEVRPFAHRRDDEVGVHSGPVLEGQIPPSTSDVHTGHPAAGGQFDTGAPV